MDHGPIRVAMTVGLRRAARVLLPGERAPRPSDKPGLAALMLDAYRGTVDFEDETLDQAIAEIERTFGGGYGRFMPECSRVVERNGQIVSATLLTRWQDRPFVAFTMTASAWKRQGLARACMINAMQDLYESGEEKLSLVVTVANTAAHELYHSLGFVRGR
jgi:ribosomal protein S18 acetylase RimI-like enzyme